ncbi:phospholipid/cholesterol/gamma-HCH transport system substrate-binding protein [Saccharothrix tamanrassetensis]|uniref:Phospholipid/cholesterol/gamma-HCH transport system substrate-binding protein n=1 Tax=Saccharothrix tamanrassetensis TaxID=1051531 RepID=A0A841CCX3_9PSEU|nr:MlaD family protein [Saccharothrix tamanrassetensis]MBB5954830.1 phospholipid/cholesterol/gamma-HCH transport system substrate-binding protein [Saccharothrix tamanrassetensis]
MIPRRIKLQIGVFVLVALVGVSYVGARYAGLGRLFGSSGYVVTMQLVDSGGVFTNAEVTYRGVAVGRVGQMRLTSDGLDVELDIDPSAPRIPADLEAVVANRSAVGEQFVDLRPRTEDGPYLAAGTVIPKTATKTPPPVDGLLSNLDAFAKSVPTDSLRTVVDELDQAFNGTGPDLQVLLDNTRAFTQAATEHLPQTKALLNDGLVVLNTQASQGSAIRSFSTDLRALAEQLKNSDADLRQLIGISPQAAEQVSELLRETGPNLGVVVANLLTTGNILVTRLDGVEQIAVTYPIAVGGGFSVAKGDGTGAHFGLAVNVFDPPPCTVGYEGTRIRQGTDTTPAPLNTGAYCALARGSATAVRGAQNAPYGGTPTTPIGGETSQPGREPVGQRAEAPVLTSLGQLLGLPG